MGDAHGFSLPIYWVWTRDDDNNMFLASFSSKP